MPGALVAAGERVTLRTLEREDVPFVQRGYASPRLRYPMGNPVRTRADLEDLAAGGDDDRFIVCLDADDAGPGDPGGGRDAAGRPGRRDGRRPEPGGRGSRDRRPELGYWIVPEVHGEGYGEEAVALAVDYAFRTYDRPAVDARAYDFNEASRGLLESLGFEEEGRLRKRRFVDGAHRDVLVYGLLRAEWAG